MAQKAGWVARTLGVLAVFLVAGWSLWILNKSVCVEVMSLLTAASDYKGTVVLADPSLPGDAGQTTDYPAVTDLPYVAHTTKYRNPQYGYSLVIPEGLIGLSSAAPDPNHGILMSLSMKSGESLRDVWDQEKDSFISVYGSYNGPLWMSLKEMVKARLRDLAKDSRTLVVLKQTRIRLAQLPAVRLLVQYIEPKLGRIRVEDIILARRQYREGSKDDFPGNPSSFMNYDLTLVTTKARYPKDKKIFERVVRTWQMLPPEDRELHAGDVVFECFSPDRQYVAGVYMFSENGVATSLTMGVNLRAVSEPSDSQPPLLELKGNEGINVVRLIWLDSRHLVVEYAAHVEAHENRSGRIHIGQEIIELQYVHRPYRSEESVSGGCAEVSHG
jgi:hypothetical protein